MVNEGGADSRLCGHPGQDMLYLPDLTAWHRWHCDRDSLPGEWKGRTLVEIARELGATPWTVCRPWQVEHPGVSATTSEEDGSREISMVTAAGTLTARWTLGPDGAWWQTEYPVKSAGDLEALLEVVRAREYVIDEADLTEALAAVGAHGVCALEVPGRPYSDLLYDFLGMGEGPVLLSEGHPVLAEVVDVLEAKLQSLVAEVARLPGRVVLSPDSLDAQFVSPLVFEECFAASYRRTTDVLGSADKALVVHVGGPIRRLLPPLAAAGIATVQGIAGPPQSDARLDDARGAAGPDLALWGGIPQDFLLEAHDRAEFEAAVVQATCEVQADSRMILGVADRVPADADLERLAAIPSLMARALGVGG